MKFQTEFDIGDIIEIVDWPLRWNVWVIATIEIACNTQFNISKRDINENRVMFFYWVNIRPPVFFNDHDRATCNRVKNRRNILQRTSMINDDEMLTESTQQSTLYVVTWWSIKIKFKSLTDEYGK